MRRTPDALLFALVVVLVAIFVPLADDVADFVNTRLQVFVTKPCKRYYIMVNE